MSHSVDECYDFYKETHRKARKGHKCDACKEAISAGHHYWLVAWVYDGEAESVKRCERCQTIHMHLRKKCREDGGYDALWPAEKLDCGLKYEDEWGELPDEIAALAFALPGEVTAPVTELEAP